MNNENNISKGFQYINVLNKEKKIFLSIIFALLITIIIISFAMYKVVVNSKVIVLPANTTKEFWITDKLVSESYFEQVSFYLADRIMSISPENAENSLISVVSFFGDDPSVNKKMKEKIKDHIRFIKKENLYNVFYPEFFKADYSKKALEVTGTLKVHVSNMLIKEYKEAKFKVSYDILHGRFIVKELDFTSIR